MSAESLLESGNIHPKGRGWATILSIAIQSLLIAAMVALPIFRPDQLRLEAKGITSPIAFDQPRATEPHTERRTHTSSQAIDPHFTYPAKPPAADQPESTVDQGPPDLHFPPSNRDGLDNKMRGLFDAIGTNNQQIVHPKPLPPVPPRISVPDPGRVINQVQPMYPVLARNAGVAGTVVLHAIIDREGRITGLQVVSGHPLLQEAARSAVRQWRYRPYFLNGQPIEVETEIIVNFNLGR